MTWHNRINDAIYRMWTTKLTWFHKHRIDPLLEFLQRISCKHKNANRHHVWIPHGTNFINNKHLLTVKSTKKCCARLCFILKMKCNSRLGEISRSLDHHSRYKCSRRGWRPRLAKSHNTVLGEISWYKAAQWSFVSSTIDGKAQST